MAGDVREWLNYKTGLLKEADRETNGAICSNIDKMITGQAGEVMSLLKEGNVAKARTETERLLSYVNYRRMCKKGE